jgi:pyocin large subunit-like protein
MRRRWLALAWALVACGPTHEVPQEDSLIARASAAQATLELRDRVPPIDTAAPARSFGSTIGFRSRRLLNEHVEKHGAEFGGITASEYLRRAQNLRDAPLSSDILEVVRADSTVSRFQRSTGYFLAFNDDGTIRTFFVPNDGEKYFLRQARRRPFR